MALPSPSARSMTATPPSGIGSGCWRSIAAISSSNSRRDALSADRLSVLQPDRGRDRAVCDPLVRAGLYRRHCARLALCPLAVEERAPVGRTSADLAAPDR